MVHRNKKAGEVLLQRVFRLLVLRRITAAARQCNAARNRRAVHRKENEAKRWITTAHLPSNNLRRCIDAARAHRSVRVVADDLRRLSIRAAV
ncbi:hypothetical protein R0290_04680 [Burkholderia semiarida]|uniref:hypothetical protein n=1 Tax=Burkholderia semiarida TaxID=2843303 RepID=UPI00345A22FB